MKIFLSGDITKSKKDPDFYGEELVARRVPDAQSQAIDRAQDRSDDAENKGLLPLGWRIVQGAATLCAGIILIALVKSDTPLGKTFANMPWLFYILGVSAVIWGILSLWAWRRKKANSAKEETIAAESRLNAIYETSYTMLGVPKDAPMADILSGRYKVKDSDVKLLGISDNMMLNLEMRVFVHEGKLCLANVRECYEIDLSAITGIRTIKKQMRITGWNKEKHFTADIYKPYKVMSNRNGIYIKPFYALTFRHEGEDWMLLFPPYELPVFEQLTGKTAQMV